jgi:expansin (peptidoglycan-binding protein)
MRQGLGAAALAALVGACSSSSGSSPGPASSGSSGGPPIALGQPEQGVATFYSATGAGNCSFDATPNDLDVAAMDAPEYAGSAVCGECVAVTGPKGSVTVRVVDKCPECEKGHLDLSAQAFAKIADPVAGRVPISWQVVACDVSGNVSYELKDGSSQYWTAIQVRNHRLPIAKLEWQTGGAWVELPRQDYNYFVADKGVGPGAYQVRVTAIGGQTLTDMLPPVQASTLVQGAGQFH